MNIFSFIASAFITICIAYDMATKGKPLDSYQWAILFFLIIIAIGVSHMIEKLEEMEIEEDEQD